MTTFTAIKLRFLSPLHIGEPGVGVEKVLSLLIHSDTLWAAVLYGWSRLGYDPAPLLPSEEEDWDPPLRLSSVFPWVEETFFFPKPVGPLLRIENVEPRQWKDIKKIRFLSQEAFERVCKGETLDEGKTEKMLSEWEKLRSRVSDFTEPHVRLGHASFASEIYYLGATSFSKEAGLYFLLHCEDKALKERFFSVLNLLQEEGIGGKRARGFGLFEWEETTVSLNLPQDDGNHWLLLSTLIPEDNLVPELGKSTFQLYRSRGWALSPTGEQGFRRPVWMILEGATFPLRPKGKVVDVTPKDWNAPHRVFRHGIGFTVPIKVQEVKGETNYG